MVEGGPDLVGDGFAALSNFFLGDETMGDTLRRVANLACEALSADMSGITMLVEGRSSTGVFTDSEALSIDEIQYQTGRGPCLDAFRNREVYRIDSTIDDERWPEFAEVAAAHGVMSTLSVPLMARSEGVGSLNVYSRRLGAFVAYDAKRTQVFAEQSATVLANAQVYWDARELNENLRDALKSRAVIDQAIGIIMATSRRNPEDAFRVLVRASQRENRKLREIAAIIVARVRTA